MNQIRFSGYGSIAELEHILLKYSRSNIFLVTGKNSYVASGAEKGIIKYLNKQKFTRFSNFENNPKLEDIKKGIEIFNNANCDMVIGIGGGSVIDMAKALSLLVTQQASPEDIIFGKVAAISSKIPSIMVPTTAGTGSESTHFSVVYISGTKYSLAHSSMLPDYSILDPTFSLNMTPYITACAGMDALCQGIESFWSVNSTGESRKYSKKAVELAIKNIVPAVKNPDKSIRKNMLIAGNYSGRAINIAKTTIAHAVSYQIARIFNIPHGHAVALTLPYFIEYNVNITLEKLQDSRGVGFVRDIMNELLEIIEVDSGKSARIKLISMMKEIDLEDNIVSLGIPGDKIESIVIKGFDKERAKNNPVLVTEKDLKTVFNNLY